MSNLNTPDAGVSTAELELAQEAEERALSWHNRLLEVAGSSWIFGVLIVMVVVFSIMSPAFSTSFNLVNILSNAAIYVVLAVGETFVIIMAGIDLSVGSVLVFSGVVAAKAMGATGGSALGATNAGWGTVTLGIAAGLAAGGAWGLINGILVAKAKIPPLIATLGTLGAALGLAQVLTNGVDLSGIPTKMTNAFGSGKVLEIPSIVICAGVIALVAGIVLSCTRFGRYTYAVGSNAESTRRAGINVDRHVISVYALQGLLVGAAAILNLARFTTTTIGSHGNDNLTVISGVVLGGTSLFGGRGGIFRTVVGILIPVVLASGLVIVGVQAFWQTVAVGIVLVVAVYIDQMRRRPRKRARRRRRSPRQSHSSTKGEVL